MLPGPSSLLQTVLALALVLALILACAWCFRRLQRPMGAFQAPMQLRGQLMVGPRERVVLIEVGDQWIVAGVAAGSVQPLAVMPRGEIATPPATGAGFGAGNGAAVPNFAALLDRMRKKSS
ncbi:flagellar biosynthetic protein FliO [Pigmentiphaga litoralis]|uniref:Flagellar protein n=1 Tax=Pigmentiphaga litoralis TaxID=516702 RepID=A0A7Y9IYZ5_9BURK|nr:flagellar biosynthetic protein FliO [Pigmentiphaga litoralis]NYE26854.1 flagellar protein FliO/FliZ [Pigmentiphaga litoralis]NYE85736.1 flagellar protein FliO/FliZ [Pigmentiphaga litoralis]